MMHWVTLIWLRSGEIFTATVCIWALIRGGLPGRIGSVTMLIGWALTNLVSPVNTGPGPLVVLIDLGMFVSYLGLAIWYRRWWTYFAAACQLNAVACHFVHKATTFGIFSYATSEGFWGGWAVVICLAWGVVDYRRQLKKRTLDAAALGA